jgi:hypothetical protein
MLVKTCTVTNNVVKNLVVYTLVCFDFIKAVHLSERERGLGTTIMKEWRLVKTCTITKNVAKKIDARI